MNGNVEKLACILCAAEMFCEGCDRCGDQRKYYHVAQVVLKAITVDEKNGILFDVLNSLGGTLVCLWKEYEENKITNTQYVDKWNGEVNKAAQAISENFADIIQVREGVQK